MEEDSSPLGGGKREGVLTIGMVGKFCLVDRVLVMVLSVVGVTGHPNVGKSSIINALMGKKV